MDGTGGMVLRVIYYNRYTVSGRHPDTQSRHIRHHRIDTLDDLLLGSVHTAHLRAMYLMGHDDMAIVNP
jgi:hypothetical protein